MSKRVASHGTLATYITGFVFSLIFTLAAYFSVVNQVFSTTALLLLVAGLALAQFLVQLFFFLHLGRETKPRWKLGLFYFMILVAAIVVIGSLWIMSSLNYRMMPHEASQRALEESGIK